jgi:hypothetical protein
MFSKFFEQLLQITMGNLSADKLLLLLGLTLFPVHHLEISHITLDGCHIRGLFTDFDGIMFNRVYSLLFDY